MAVRWSNNYDTEMRSYVNVIATPKGGTHVSGFEAALTKTFNDSILGLDREFDSSGSITTYYLRDASGNVLAIEKRAVRSGENRYSVKVSGEPARAGIDPLNKLIDRDDNDNTVAVSIR